MPSRGSSASGTGPNPARPRISRACSAAPRFDPPTSAISSRRRLLRRRPQYPTRPERSRSPICDTTPYDPPMRLVQELLRISATDLANHVGCVHLSQLNRAHAEGRAHKPFWNDPVGMLLRERGIEHEKAYLEHLRATGGGQVVEIDAESDDDAVAQTLAAMRAGADVIYQAPLGGERWYGRAG